MNLKGFPFEPIGGGISLNGEGGGGAGGLPG